MRLACSGQRWPRLGLDARQLGLGHAGIVLERHAGDAGAIVLAAHDPGEGDDGADVGAAGGEAAHVGADVEVLALDAYTQGSASGHRRKKATSRAPARLAVGRLDRVERRRLEARASQRLHAPPERAHPGQDHGVGPIDEVTVRRETRVRADVLEALLRRAQVADAVVEHRDEGSIAQYTHLTGPTS